MPNTFDLDASFNLEAFLLGDYASKPEVLLEFVKNERLDPRHIHRIHVVQALYALQFKGGNYLPEHQEFINTAQQIVSRMEEIDAIITRHAIKSIASTPLVIVCILRCAIYELMTAEDTPMKVIANEVVQMAKEFYGATMAAFVNAVVGATIDELIAAGKLLATKPNPAEVRLPQESLIDIPIVIPPAI